MEEKKEYYLIEIGKLFLKYGVSGITMEEIATRIGISKKTIYNYFENKAEIVELIIQQRFKNDNEAMWETITQGKNAIEILVRITNQMKETIREVPPFVRRDLMKHFPLQLEKIGRNHKNNVFEGVRKNILMGIYQDIYRSNINVELIARYYVNSLDQFIREEVMAGTEIPIDAYYDEILSYHIHGIATAKGVTILEEIINPTK
ncbi:TetR/AcrR family transcriptional regulator [Williamwhitmania taraxaci]|uniref:Transcriptional regulator, TetR family n=1 Tax=Williamwhitmania taraxaci TaxID=1640674 RepID=A0A1G6GWZ7_9BACT|nr:TetR/AcrR family transcriptional regulator [Williamwhitmania taraxaci]SDB86562.1 transcriptional regulator, TetR family [Williamwhitmania taraxaci]